MRRAGYLLPGILWILLSLRLAGQGSCTVYFQIPDFRVGYQSPAGYLTVSNDTLTRKLSASGTLLLPKGDYRLVYTTWLGNTMDTVIEVRRKRQEVHFHSPIAAWRLAELPQILNTGDSICYFQESHGCFGSVSVSYGWLKWNGDTLYGELRQYLAPEPIGIYSVYPCKIHKEQLLKNIQTAIAAYGNGDRFCSALNYHHAFMTRHLVFPISLGGCLSDTEVFAHD